MISQRLLTLSVQAKHAVTRLIFAHYIMIRTFGAYRCFATIMIKFAVRQLCEHFDSLALIISCIWHL